MFRVEQIKSCAPAEVSETVTRIAAELSGMLIELQLSPEVLEQLKKKMGADSGVLKIELSTDLALSCVNECAVIEEKMRTALLQLVDDLLVANEESDSDSGLNARPDARFGQKKQNFRKGLRSRKKVY